MSYEQPLRISHQLGAVTTSATVTKSIKGPAGRRGRLAAIAASVTTTTVGAAIAVQVGVTGDLAKFGELAIGAQTAPEALSTEKFKRDSQGQVMIPADTEVLVTIVGGTSGVVETTVVVDYF